MSVSVQSATTASSIRRKPQFTYQSPPANEFREPTKLLVHSKKPLTSFKVPAPTLSTPKPAPSPVKTNNLPTSSSLPLYHPLGRLALSLPPLDPAKYGLPVPIRADSDLLPQSSSTTINGKSSWRATPTNGSTQRDPSATGSTVAVEEPSASTSTTVEKPSPRKRRNAGGAGAKRRRKDADEDASYPAVAKRPRLPRGVASAANSNVEEEGEEPSTAVVDVTEERKPERRTTRSRGAATRRGSTASETSGSASNSVSVTRAASAARKDEGNDVVMSSEKAETGNTTKRRSRSKEEGEVSEESK